jgi:hypothetical protein
MSFIPSFPTHYPTFTDEYNLHSMVFSSTDWNIVGNQTKLLAVPPVNIFKRNAPIIVFPSSIHTTHARKIKSAHTSITPLSMVPTGYLSLKNSTCKT